MIFVDSNIPMYLIGAQHPNKDASRRLLELCIDRGERLVSDAVVMQEILHRYIAISRPDAIQPAFDALLHVVDHVYPVEPADVERAKQVLLVSTGLSARNALHVAIMERYEIHQLLSFDAGFDRVLWIERLREP